MSHKLNFFEVTHSENCWYLSAEFVFSQDGKDTLFCSQVSKAQERSDETGRKQLFPILRAGGKTLWGILSTLKNMLYLINIAS